jgi:hypothetical protein
LPLRPTRRVRRVGQLRCPLWALPSPGSLVGVQTAQLVTETLVSAQTRPRGPTTISSGLYRFLAIAVLLDVKDIPQVGPLQWGWIIRPTTGHWVPATHRAGSLAQNDWSLAFGSRRPTGRVDLCPRRIASCCSRSRMAQLLDIAGPLQMFAGANDELSRQVYRITQCYLTKLDAAHSRDCRLQIATHHFDPRTRSMKKPTTKSKKI